MKTSLPSPTLKALSLAIGLVLAGCSQVPTYEQPKTDLPQTLGQTHQAPGLVLAANEKDWWAQFANAELQDLLNQALANNADFAIAQQRLYQARSALTQGRAGLLPNVSVEAGVSNQETSNLSFPAGQGAEFDNVNLSGLISYEVDLWGRVRANRDRLSAEYKAMQADQVALRLSLSSAVAQNYFNLRALDQMVEIASNTVISRKETLQLRQRQYELGRLTQLAVQQAEVELSRVDIQLINLQQRRDAQRHALSVLIGETPQQMLARSQAQAADAMFEHYSLPILPAELNSELLMRRPDIQAAEQRLIAANANIGVARAALFPKLSLNGMLGFSSESFDNLFESDAAQSRVQAGLSAPIFNAGALRAQVKISEAQQQITLQQYQQTLRQAFAETLDALSMQQRSQQQLDAQLRQVSALRLTLDLAQKRFDSGYSSYLEVLDAQRALFDAEVSMVNTKLNHLNANIQLYKAIGGHWSNDQATAS